MSAFVDPGPEHVLNPKLTLSAVGEGGPQPKRGSSAPAEAAIRDERDPLTPGLLAELDHYTESELRLIWGDR